MAEATITPEQKAAAAKEQRAAKEKERRAAIKRAGDALEKAGLPRDTQLTADQRKRAADSGTEKPGLAKKALATWILEGQGLGEQAEAAKAANTAKTAEEKTRQNVTRSQDPEAAELAVNAKKLAPEVKSAFLPKDAREFIDDFTATKAGQKVTIKRGDVTVELKTADLRKFGVDGEKDPEVRKCLAEVGRGSRLWGRKLALMVLASVK